MSSEAETRKTAAMRLADELTKSDVYILRGDAEGIARVMEASAVLGDYIEELPPVGTTPYGREWAINEVRDTVLPKLRLVALGPDAREVTNRYGKNDYAWAMETKSCGLLLRSLLRHL